MLHAANSVLRAEMSIGDFVLVNTYFLQLYQPLNWIGTIYRVIQQNFIEMESLFDLLDTPIEVSDAPGAPPLMISSARIDFENVSFAYEKRADARLILDQVSFSVLPGETVAFVGESG
ncbi:hypothetical protein T484DRAFT_3187578 [Baffinella frigidus]|nr:hypothetical protein T484DRAFT_3187578 [Cryptophyta sp. CCMP2293]